MNDTDLSRFKAALISAPGQVYYIPFLYRAERIESREFLGMIRPVVVFSNLRSGADNMLLSDLTLDDFRIISLIP